jgi:hypothetical protein
MDTNNDKRDFKELNDRIIAEASTSPKIVAKMTTDPSNALEDNPYTEEEMKIQNQKILAYFED